MSKFLPLPCNKDEYWKKAVDITQEYIEKFGAGFHEIDELDCMIASALREASEYRTHRFEQVGKGMNMKTNVALYIGIAYIAFMFLRVILDIGEYRPGYTVDAYLLLGVIGAMVIPFVLGYMAGKWSKEKE